MMAGYLLFQFSLIVCSASLQGNP